MFKSRSWADYNRKEQLGGMHDPISFFHYNKTIPICSKKQLYLRILFFIRCTHVIIKIFNINNRDMKQVGRRHGMNIAESVLQIYNLNYILDEHEIPCVSLTLDIYTSLNTKDEGRLKLLYLFVGQLLGFWLLQVRKKNGFLCCKPKENTPCSLKQLALKATSNRYPS